MTDWQEAYYDLVNKVECECVQQGDLVPIWDQFKRMSLTITKLHGHQGAMETELAKFKALAETLAGALEKIAPITVRDGPDYAEVYFADGKTHSTQAMTMNPQDWLDLSEALRKYKEARDV